MSSVVDVWRAVDPDAKLLPGSPAAALGRPVRAVQRTRSAPPHLPAPLDGGLLVADGTLAASLDGLLAALEEAGLEPAAVIVTGSPPTTQQPVGSAVPVLISQQPPAHLTQRATAYLADEAGWLARLATELRLLCAEAALGEPEVGTPAGLIAARTNRGVAVSADGELRSLHPRAAGRALAGRFAALHSRLLAGGGQHGPSSRRTRDGLWLLERRIRPGAALWLFDDLPFAAADEVAADAAAVTLRALLRRRPEVRAAARPIDRAAPTPMPAPPGADDPLTATLLAVARHNGRVAPAARELGVHRNTVLYRLRRAAAEFGLDPRRPDDALRLLSGR